METEAEPNVISRSPNIMSGAPVFHGTRVPVQSLLDYISGGHSLDEFLDDFPTVRREQALRLLQTLKNSLQTAQV